MKNYIKSIFLVLVVFLASCESLVDGINENPNELPLGDVSPALFLSGAMLANNVAQAGHWNRIAGMYQSKKEWKTAFDSKDQEQMKYILENKKIEHNQIKAQWRTAVFRDELASVETMAKYGSELDIKVIQESLPRVQSKEMAKLLIEYGGFPKQSVRKNHPYYNVYLPALFQIKDTTILEIFLKNGCPCYY